MDQDKTVKDPFMQVVEDHLASGEPPMTKAAYDRLVGKGHTPVEAKQMISGVVRGEMQLMMSTGGAFDDARFKVALEKMLAAQG